MAFQSIWYFTDLPEKVIDLIEEDLTETFDPQMADSKLHGDSLNKRKEIRKMHGFLPVIGLQGSFGIIYREQIERISCMI
tara:strand:- start:36 stop:275 length:240 start_codon:yes stop_codon:yes gene_type:complete